MPAKLDPDAAAVYRAFQDAGRPAYETLTADEARAYYSAARLVSNPEARELASVQELAIPGPAGDIPARVYTPKALRQDNGLAPALVFFHGGGWVIGDLDTHDVVCRAIADDGQLVVISIDYRLAPEHKFPAAVDDAIAATGWIASHAKKLGIDPERLCVGGDSAGGNLAAALSLRARDAGGPDIALQLLLYPVLDWDFERASYRDYGGGDHLISRADMAWFWDQHVAAEDRANPLAAPLRAPDLAGLPEAVVVVAGCDPLHDEGIAYARRLAEAGVPVTVKDHGDMAHGFFTLVDLIGPANAAVADIGGMIGRRLRAGD